MVKVNASQCVGCGVCQRLCPDGFEIVNGVAKVKNANADCIERAMSVCPVGAITAGN